MAKLFARCVRLSLVLLLFNVIPTNISLAQEQVTSVPPERQFLISQINLGNEDNNYELQEYVAITNTTDSALNPNGLKLEYLKATDNADSLICNLFPWPAGAVGSDYTVIELANQELLEPNETLLVELSLTNSRGGSLRLSEIVNDTLIFHDLVGWNRQDSVSECFRQQPVDINSELVSTRLQHFNLDYTDSRHNFDDFEPGFGPYVDLCANILDLQLELADNQQVNDLGECFEIQQSNQCDLVRISEVLPNPDGSDSGNEFIELQNTSDQQVYLEGCSLQVNDSAEVDLTAVTLEPNQHKALFNSNYSFTLPNASGGTVYLLSAADEIDSVQYPQALENDQSYARFDNAKWRATYTLTPGAENKHTEFLPCPAGQFRNPDTNRCNNITSSSTGGELADCGPGRYRSPETNRCRQVEAANQLTPCGVDEYRSPETNRCRKVTTTTSSLKPCAPNQYRNPETNRCKKIETSTALADCGPGRERNPETNRCRNVATLASASSSIGGGLVEGASSVNAEESPAPSEINIPLVSVAAVSAASYGLYEYRQDIQALIWKLKKTLKI